MEHDRPIEADQLNMDPLSEMAEFDIDDIIAEFGSHAEEKAASLPSAAENESEDAPKDETEDETVRIWTPKPRTGTPVSEAEPEPEAQAESVPGSDEQFEPEPEMPILKAVPPVTAKRKGGLRRFLARRKARRETVERATAAFTPSDARETYLHLWRVRRLPLILSWLLTVLSVALIFARAQTRFPLPDFLSSSLCDAFCVGVLLIQILLALPVLSDGVQSVLNLRFTQKSYLALTTLVAAIFGIRALLSGEDGGALCAVASLLLTVSLQGDCLLIAAKTRCLTCVLSMDEPKAAVRREGQWEKLDCISRKSAQEENWVSVLEENPGWDKFLCITCALSAALTFAASLLASVKGGRDFLWAWTILLLGSFPLGAAWAYGRSFRNLNKKLAAANAAVLGWGGAKRFSGNLGVIIRDDDLFSKKSVMLNGVKVFGTHTSDRLLSYAAAMLDRAEAGAAAAFSESLALQSSQRFRTDQFRAYDMGGLGATIRGDVVLLGSRSFLCTMGVEIPPEARLDRALYISLNGELAGLFALRYNPSDSVRSGLCAILSDGGLHPILATRDALLSPEMIGKIYKIPPERLEYPLIRDRLALSDTETDGAFAQCAFLARSSFLSFSAVITGGRRLLRSVRQGMLIAFTGSVVGFLTMTLLALMGAADSAGAANLLLYHLIWLLPSFLATSLFKK